MVNKPKTDGGLRELALFAGAGGGILGGILLGWKTVCAVEYDKYAASVLLSRQNDGILAPFPIWDDVRTFDGKPWNGIVDVVSGGFPCQDISTAGKGAGITGERSGLWKEMARIVGEVRPRFVWIENSPALIGRGLEVVLADLRAMGYDARWGVVSAENAGAPHQRKRIWILANSESNRHGERGKSRNFFEKDGRQNRKMCAEFSFTGEKSENVADTMCSRFRNAGAFHKKKRDTESTHKSSRDRKKQQNNWWEIEPGLG